MMHCFLLCREKVLNQMEELLVGIPFVLYDQIVGLAVFEKWCCNRILFVKVLLEKQGREWFIYVCKLGIEGTVAKGNLGNNSFLFDIVVVVKKFQIENFDRRTF